MKKYKVVFLFILSSFCFFTFFISSQPKNNPFSSSQCLDCHGSKSSYRLELKINQKSFKQSVHAHLQCTDCHQIIPENKQLTLPHKKDLPDVNCTKYVISSPNNLKKS